MIWVMMGRMEEVFPLGVLTLRYLKMADLNKGTVRIAGTGVLKYMILNQLHSFFSDIPEFWRLQDLYDCFLKGTFHALLHFSTGL